MTITHTISRLLVLCCSLLFFARTAPTRAEEPRLSYYDKITEAADYIRARWDQTPDVLIILGTGLGHLAERIEADVVLPYEQIPHFAVSTVESHAGNLILGSLEGKRVIAMQGRFHLYEGYTPQEVVFPIFVANRLGAKRLFVSNAAGGMNPRYERGDIVLIEDHINLFGCNPLTGPNDDRLGPRFPDMIEPYSHHLIKLAEETALSLGIKTHQGVYVGLLGPNFETRAEYRFLKGIGADVVGMSTVPEVIAARYLSMEVLGISVVTDMCLPDLRETADHALITEAANSAEPKMNDIICGVLKQLD